MDLSFLPIETWNKYQDIVRKKNEANSSDISLVFSQSLDLLGKIVLLEYAQQKIEQQTVNYHIFKHDIREPGDWLKVLPFVYQALNGSTNLVTGVMSIKEKYPSLRAEEEDDKLTRLLWFYDVCAHEVLANNEMAEYQELLQNWLLELSFLNEVKFEVYDGIPRLLFGGCALALNPFFHLKLIGSEGLRLCFSSPDDIFQLYATNWFGDAYSKHCQEKEGDGNFILQEQEQGCVVTPWLEILVKDTFDDALSAPIDLHLQKIFIAGTLGSGKTTLACNLDKFLSLDSFVFLFTCSKKDMFL